MCNCSTIFCEGVSHQVVIGRIGSWRPRTGENYRFGMGILYRSTRQLQQGLRSWVWVHIVTLLWPRIASNRFFWRILVVHVVLVLIMRLNIYVWQTSGFWVPRPVVCRYCYTIMNKTKMPCSYFGASQFLTSYSWLSAILTSSQPPSLSQTAVNWAKKC